MSERLDDLYLTWLYSQIGSVKLRSKRRTYWSLARQLFTKEFVWIVPNDDNRAEDGKELRMEFIHEQEIEFVDPDWLDEGCSFLEMLIGLARRLAFETDRPSISWFWRLMENLDLEQYTDQNYGDECQAIIDETLERVIWRIYAPDGRGGLFPLEDPRQDQRDVEIWYQLCSYLAEQE